MIRNIFTRFAKMLVGSVVMSSVACALCVCGVLMYDTWQRNAVLTALPIIYIIWNFKSLSSCYFEMHGDKKYYVINLIATAAFSLTSIFSFLFLPRTSYSWLFLVTGLGSFLNFVVRAQIAILSFHAIMNISIFLAPIGLGWVKIKAMERRELREMAPGILEVNPLEQKRKSTEVQTNEIQKTKEKDSLS